MPSLCRGQASNCTNPVLDIYTAVAGTRTDVALLEFQIFERITNPNAPVQVYPLSGRQLVDDALCPTGAKLGTGHYVAVWTPSLAALTGTYEIRWFFKLALQAPEQTLVEEFTVLTEVAGSTTDGYTSVAALREEGVGSEHSDARLLTLIARTSQWIERWTGRWFEPRSCTYRLDGTGGSVLFLQEPIIRIESVRFTYDELGDDEYMELGSLRIYNRHLTQRLTNPDDRDNPRLEWITDYGFERTRRGVAWDSGCWPRGCQNIEVSGIFGYTEYDGTPLGRTPLDIQLATQMLVVRELAPVADTDARQEAWMSGRIASMSTQGQSISWSSGSGATSAPFSGDPQIDRLLAPYTRIPNMAAV
jgi:hypothetical protein